MSVAVPRGQDPPLPADLRPMLAASARPEEAPLASPDYSFEVKWDGMRVLLGMDGDTICFRSRTGIEATARYPELAVVRHLVTPGRVVLDGEIVRLVDGKPSFFALQRRIQASNPRDIEALSVTEPTALILFDVLRVEDTWLLDQPWHERRRRLEGIATGDTTVQISPVWPDGRVLWDTVCGLGLEGLIAKHRMRSYTPGRRSPSWIKVKTTETVEAVVGGWSDGTGSRSSGMGALLVGIPAGGRLTYIGHVGTGFDQQMLLDTYADLKTPETTDCPFTVRPPRHGKAHWVRPERVCEVKFQGWTNDARLRAPVFIRWRPDKTPADCCADVPAPY